MRRFKCYIKPPYYHEEQLLSIRGSEWLRTAKWIRCDTARSHLVTRLIPSICQVNALTHQAANHNTLPPEQRPAAAQISWSCRTEFHINGDKYISHVSSLRPRQLSVNTD